MSATADVLRERIIATALEHRAAGVAIRAVDPCTPSDAFLQAVGQLHETLRGLGNEEWSAPAHPEIGAVRDVITHLLGVERLVDRWLTTGVREASEHLTAAGAMAGDVSGLDSASLLELWHTSALQAHAACAGADAEAPVLAHDLPTDVSGLLVLRTFECWAHLQDVCRATATPVARLEAPRLALMTERLAESLPVALLLRGVQPPVGTLRLVLTGDIAACHDITFDAVLATRLTITADAVEVCRVAARRLPADDLAMAVDGDASAARAIAACLDAFARD